MSENKWTYHNEPQNVCPECGIGQHYLSFGFKVDYMELHLETFNLDQAKAPETLQNIATILGYPGSLQAQTLKLMTNQQALGAEFQKVIHDNLWSLYERSVDEASTFDPDGIPNEGLAALLCCIKIFEGLQQTTSVQTVLTHLRQLEADTPHASKGNQ